MRQATPPRQSVPAQPRSVPAQAQSVSALPGSSAEVLAPERSWLPMFVVVVALTSLAALAVGVIWSAAGAPHVRLQWPALERFASALARNRVSIIVIAFGLSALAALEWLLLSAVLR
jgi:hypothetical protein